MATKKKTVKKAPKDTIVKIRRAMKAVQKSGGKVQTGIWGARFSESKGHFTDYQQDGVRGPVCALGALLVYTNGDLKYKPTQGKKKLDKTDTDDMAGYILGVDQDWVGNFISGFDRQDLSETLNLKKKAKGGPDVCIEVDRDGLAEFVTYDADCYDGKRRKLKVTELTAASAESLHAYQMGCKLREEFGLI